MKRFLSDLLEKTETKIMSAIVMVQIAVLPASAQDDLNSSVDSLTNLTTNIRDLAIVVAGLVGIVMAAWGLSKLFGISETRPGEPKTKYALMTLGGGALVSIVSFTDLATNTIIPG